MMASLRIAPFAFAAPALLASLAALIADLDAFVLVPNLDRFEERRRNGELRWLRADGSRPA